MKVPRGTVHSGKANLFFSGFDLSTLKCAQCVDLILGYLELVGNPPRSIAVQIKTREVIRYRVSRWIKLIAVSFCFLLELCFGVPIGTIGTIL